LPRTESFCAWAASIAAARATRSDPCASACCTHYGKVHGAATAACASPGSAHDAINTVLAKSDRFIAFP
jgi:hypothetical protein